MKVFVSGAKSGIGLELTKQLLNKGNFVIAACRNHDKANDLLRLKADKPDELTIIELDITENSSIKAAASAVLNEVDELDLIINSVGVYDEPVFGHINMNDCVEMFKVNAFGPLLIIQELQWLLKKTESKIVNISGGMGSIAGVTKGGHYNYSASKATLNMYSKILSKELQTKGVIVLTIDPGWVRTRLGGPEAPLSVEESAGSIINIVKNAVLSDSGKFVDVYNRELPW